MGEALPGVPFVRLAREAELSLRPSMVGMSDHIQMIQMLFGGHSPPCIPAFRFSATPKQRYRILKAPARRPSQNWQPKQVSVQ
jgi:hypothetical protein